MKRRGFLKWTGATGAITLITPANISKVFYPKTSSDLEEIFIPPDSAKPYTMWFWMNGNLTKEGITLDLEAMKSAGIGGIFNFDVGTDIPKGTRNKGIIIMPRNIIYDQGRTLEQRAIVQV